MAKLKKGILFDLDQTLVDSSRAEYNRKHQNWTLVYQEICRFHRYPGVSKTIQDLKSAGWKVGIVTSSPKKYAEKVVQQFGLKCDTLICYHDTFLRKPYPDPYVKALGAMKVKRAFSFAVGDTQDDIDAANTLEIISIWARWGVNQAYPNVKDYDSSFDHIRDLGDLLLNRDNRRAEEKRTTVTDDSQGKTVDALVKAKYGIEITGGPARFYKKNEWFKVDYTVNCPHCYIPYPLRGNVQCIIYRCPYETVGRIQHYWAFVCLECNKAITLNDLHPEDKKGLTRDV